LGAEATKECIQTTKEVLSENFVPNIDNLSEQFDVLEPKPRESLWDYAVDDLVLEPYKDRADEVWGCIAYDHPKRRFYEGSKE